MNTAALRLLCLRFSLLSAVLTTTAPAQALDPMKGEGKTEVANPWKAPRPVLPDAVLRAKVQARTVSVYPDGSSLTIDIIAPPVLPAPTTLELPAMASQPAALDSATAGAALPDLTTAAKTPGGGMPRRLTELKLFSPAITVYEGTGISRITWWGGKGLKEFSALVRVDLSSIAACGDLERDGRRWLLLPAMRSGNARFAAKEKVPALTDFQLDTDIILTKGDPADTEALVPLQVLLEKYDTEGGLIASTAAAMKADQEARAAWEKAHPEKPEQVTVKMWPVQSTEYPTAQTKP